MCLGLKSKEGDPVRKPWAAATDDEALLQELSKWQCPGEECARRHVECGSRRAEAAGAYTDHFARSVHMAWHQSASSERVAAMVDAPCPVAAPASAGARRYRLVQLAAPPSHTGGPTRRGSPAARFASISASAGGRSWLRSRSLPLRTWRPCFSLTAVTSMSMTM